MKQNALLFIKGMIIGIAAILPGVSGGVIAVTLGIYEKVIYYASHFLKEIKKGIAFLLPILFGSAVAVVLTSFVLSSALKKYDVQTTLLFLGLLIGGIPSLIAKTKQKKPETKNITIMLIAFIISLSFMLVSGVENLASFTNMNIIGYIKLFVVGLIAAFTLVVPGISGSLLLMIIGYYQPIIETITSLFKLNDIVNNLLILIPFGIGIIVGILLLSKLINFLLKKYPHQTYYAIYGIIFASIVGIIIPLFGAPLTQLLIGGLLLILGLVIAYRLGAE